jgi:hypothetical protein
MSLQFGELRERLLRAGVAPLHVRRYLTELGEHFADLKAEEERAGRNRAEADSVAAARLGSIDSLAATMIAQKGLRSWAARAPWAVFGIAPVAIMAGACAMAMFLMWLGVTLIGNEALGSDAQGSPIIQRWQIILFRFEDFVDQVLPFLTGWGIGIIAIRQRRPLAWPLIGLALIALIRSLPPWLLAIHLDLDKPGNVFSPNFAPWVQVCFKVCADYGPHVDVPWGFANLMLTAAPLIIWRYWVGGRDGRAMRGRN